MNGDAGRRRITTSISVRSYDLSDLPFDVEPYWREVVEALQRDFGHDSGLAEAKTRLLRSQLLDRPAGEQILFLHESPLSVASRLASDRDLTDQLS